MCSLMLNLIIFHSICFVGLRSFLFNDDRIDSCDIEEFNFVGSKLTATRHVVKEMLKSDEAQSDVTEIYTNFHAQRL